MDRREFTNILFGAPLLLAETPDWRWKGFRRKTRKPARLQKGDKVGLIAPASAASQKKFEKAIINLESLGLRVVIGDYAKTKTGFLAGTDEQRLQDLHTMYADKSIKAIWAVRGGYGTTRLLQKIDYSLIRQNPKILIGYSDITALTNAIYERAGVVGFHGPVGSSDFTRFNVKNLQRMLFEGADRTELIIGQSNLDRTEDSSLQRTHEAFFPRVIRPGVMTGKLVGGNLTLLSSMAGTGYLPDFKDKIVFLEDIGEKPYRIDRMLTQLLTANNLGEAAGILLGVFEDCETDDETSFSLKQVLNERLSELGIPVFYGFPIGHIRDQVTIPVGVKAKFSTISQVLTILESPFHS